jgi:hypothetical protein
MQSVLFILLTSFSNTTLFFIAIVVLFVIAGIRQGAPAYFSYIFTNALKINNYKNVNHKVADASFTAPFYYIIYFFSLAFLLFQFIVRKYPNVFVHKLETYFLIIGILFLYFSCRYLIIKLLGWTFKFEENASLFIAESNLIDKFIGICLIPVCLLIQLFPEKTHIPMYIFIIFLLFIFNILKYIRCIAVVNKMAGISFLHFILYLSTLEIAPLLIFYTLLHIK